MSKTKDMLLVEFELLRQSLFTVINHCTDLLQKVYIHHAQLLRKPSTEFDPIMDNAATEIYGSKLATILDSVLYDLNCLSIIARKEVEGVKDE
jgi:hypothetical protein